MCIYPVGTARRGRLTLQQATPSGACGVGTERDLTHADHMAVGGKVQGNQVPPYCQVLGPDTLHRKNDMSSRKNANGQGQACPDSGEGIARFRVRGRSPTGTGERGQGLCPGPGWCLALTGRWGGRRTQGSLRCLWRLPPQAPLPLAPTPPSSGRACRVASAGGAQSLHWWAGVGEGPKGLLPGCGLGVPTVTQGTGLEGSPTVSRGLFWGNIPRASPGLTPVQPAGH